MSPSIDEVLAQSKSRLNAIKSAQDLEAFRIETLGKKGSVTLLMEHLKNLPAAEKPEFGKKVNELKKQIEEAIQSKKDSLDDSASDTEIFDETLPLIEPKRGRLHPITQTILQITKIFDRLGFETVQGPEIETEFYNFNALNIPLDHPARDGFDTLYTPGGQLLRSQTSTVQIRIMQNQKPPLRIIAPGRVYRPDQVDASHSFMFHQIEGLLVDENVTFAHLKGILHLFLRELFGKETKVRFRPHFFPFTEPSVEVDIRWTKGWLEILGAGSVHPNVFNAVGYDPKRVQGFAFGLGVERIAMLLHGINDIRYFYDNDIRFLRQF